MSSPKMSTLLGGQDKIKTRYIFTQAYQQAYPTVYSAGKLHKVRSRILNKFRGFSAEEYSSAAKNLSEFQIEKFSWFFTQFLDSNKNGVIDGMDFGGITELFRSYAGKN